MATGRVAVRIATWADVKSLQGRLRASDKLEIAATSGADPDYALARSFEMSLSAWTGTVCDEPFIMFGVAAPSIMSSTGAPWLLGTDAVEREGVAVAKRSWQYVEEMRKGFFMLENHTDDRHTSAHRWLRWCGFHMEEPAPWGVQGLPFRRFWMDGLLGQ
jgi:hypothetical protein